MKPAWLYCDGWVVCMYAGRRVPGGVVILQHCALLPGVLSAPSGCLPHCVTVLCMVLQPHMISSAAPGTGLTRILRVLVVGLSLVLSVSLKDQDGFEGLRLV